MQTNPTARSIDLIKERRMSLVHIAAGVAGLMGGAIILIGVGYLLAPQATAATFGLPVIPSGDGAAWLQVKGVRDVVSGLLGLALLADGLYRELGWFLIIVALIPIGDGLIVVRHPGSTVLAYGIHGATAAVLLATGSVLLFA
jgi:hypothetical protein